MQFFVTLLKERHFRSWLIRSPIFSHKKLKVVSKTVLKPISLRNATIFHRAQEKMLTSMQEFVCAARIYQSDAVENN
jgi:hypothetical protein